MRSPEIGFDNGRLVGAGLALLTALVAPQARAEGLSVSILGPLQCPSQSQVLMALGEHVDAGGPTQGQLELSAPRPGVLHLTLRQPSTPPFGRDFEVRSSDCEAIAQTVALLAEAWLRPLPRVATVDPEVAECESAPTDAPPPSPVSRTVMVSPRPLPSIGVAVAASSPREPFVHLMLRLAGGGDVGFGSSYGFNSMGKLTTELGIGARWSIGVSAALKSEFVYETKTQWHMPITLFARAALHAPGKSGFSLAAGLLLDITRADPGYDGRYTFYELGAAASVMWEYPFARHFSAFVDVGLSALFGNAQLVGPPRTIYTVSGSVASYDYLRVPNAWGDITTGLACRFF
jgi:hypothetical protein